MSNPPCRARRPCAAPTHSTCCPRRGLPLSRLPPRARILPRPSSLACRGRASSMAARRRLAWCCPPRLPEARQTANRTRRGDPCACLSGLAEGADRPCVLFGWPGEKIKADLGGTPLGWVDESVVSFLSQSPPTPAPTGVQVGIHGVDPCHLSGGNLMSMDTCLPRVSRGHLREELRVHPRTRCANPAGSLNFQEAYPLSCHSLSARVSSIGRAPATRASSALARRNGISGGGLGEASSFFRRA